MKFSSIDDLCQALLAEFQQDPKGKQVASLLRTYSQTCEDWRDFVCYDDQRYTRNLVHRCGEYELLLLCWEQGQVSPIHNHAGQNCWMGVLDGTLEEVHYRKDAGGEAGLAEGRSTQYTAGGVAFIEDDIALHLIRPVGGRGVSLHLYAQPIDTCLIYCPDTGREETVAMGYFSVRGEPCTRSVEAIRADYGS